MGLLAIFLWRKMGEFNTSRGKVVYSLLGMGIVIVVPALLIFNSIFTPRPITFFITDQTDGFGAATASSVKQLVLKNIDATKGNSNIVFYEIGKYSGQLNPVVDYSIPPRKKVMALIDSVPEEEEKIYQAKYNLFRQGVAASLDKLIGDVNSPSSYILEGVSAVARQQFPSHPREASHLILISDLLQFSPNLDFYHGDVPALKSFLLSDKGRIFVADDFKDVWVSVYVIDRPFYQANPAKKILAKKFWRDYFFNRGAYRVDMVDVAT